MTPEVHRNCMFSFSSYEIWKIGNGCWISSGCLLSLYLDLADIHPLILVTLSAQNWKDLGSFGCYSFMLSLLSLKKTVVVFFLFLYCLFSFFIFRGYLIVSLVVRFLISLNNISFHTQNIDGLLRIFSWCSRYADFLTRLNDDQNIRALFERSLSTLRPEESVEVGLISYFLVFLKKFHIS